MINSSGFLKEREKHIMFNGYYKSQLINTLTKIVGNYLVNQNEYFGLIDDMILDVIHENNKDINILRNDHIYMLFRRIIEDTQLNINSLISTNENNDNFRYTDIKRNTRSIIEAFIDMINLFYDKDYIEIIKFNCKMKNVNKEKIKNILKKTNIKWDNTFINTKRKIYLASQYDASKVINIEEFYPKLIEYLNKYSHPNIFIQSIDRQSNCKSLYSTLLVALECLDLSFCLFIMYVWGYVLKNEDMNPTIEFSNKLSYPIQCCYNSLKEWLLVHNK